MTINAREALRPIIRQFPAEIREGQMTQLDRFAFDIGLVQKHSQPGARVCDIGGGWGAFALGCAAVGFKAVLMDDFRDRGFQDEAVMGPMRELYASHGVEVVSRDVVANQLDFPPRSLDVITIFDSLEHWHNSPKRLLACIPPALKAGGLFILATPNCVNLRKRITVPLGRGKWTAMQDWYEQETFRGHVREPDVDDLRYIAADMGLKNYDIIGRNWAGHMAASPLVRRLTPFADHILRLRPSLCSDLYLLAHVDR